MVRSPRHQRSEPAERHYRPGEDVTLAASHYQKPQDFLNRTGRKLKAGRIRYGLILGICNRLNEDLHEYGTEDPWFLTLEEEGVVAAVAIRTPPFDVLLAAFPRGTPELGERLAMEVSTAYNKIPGVTGEPEIADAFARTWCDSRKARIRRTMHQRVYGLAKVKTISQAPGRLRQASAEDRETVTRWVAGFERDTFGHTEEEGIADRVSKMLRRGDLYIWEDGQPVSMAARSRPTGDVITIGMVYTPPDKRNRGYASSCVADLCQVFLERGYRYCSLYTDLSNPTSNKIYKRIGFTEVCDSVNHAFSYQPR